MDNSEVKWCDETARQAGLLVWNDDCWGVGSRNGLFDGWTGGRGAGGSVTSVTCNHSKHYTAVVRQAHHTHSCEKMTQTYLINTAAQVAWLRTHRRSPIQVLTGPDVEQLRWSRSTHYYHQATPPLVTLFVMIPCWRRLVHSSRRWQRSHPELAPADDETAHEGLGSALEHVLCPSTCCKSHTNTLRSSPQYSHQSTVLQSN